MAWALLVITVAAFAYSWYQQANPEKQKAKAQRITGPTADEGISIPVLFGTMVIESPNTCWFGGQQSIKKTNDFNQEFYYYNAGLQLALCHGQLDSINHILIGESDNDCINNAISADSRVWLSGSVERQDAQSTTQGWVNVRLGTVNTARAVNAGNTDNYINTAMGLANGPRYFGTAMLESDGLLYFGKQTSIPGLAVEATRIHTCQGGRYPQWYDVKAEIVLGRNREDTWKYNLVDLSDMTDSSGAAFDDSAWASGRGGFGNAPKDVLAWSYLQVDGPDSYP